MPHYIFIDKIAVVDADDVFAGIIDKDVLHKGVVKSHLQRREFFLDEFDVKDEDGPCVWRQLRIVKAVATYFTIKEAVC